MDTLRSRWHADVIALCPDADRGRVSDEVTDLLDRWLEDHRSYHDAVHLAEVLAALDELHEGGDLPARDRHLAGLVAWYHDAVYEPEASPGGNEEASARLAQERLTALGLAPADSDLVARLVRESASHEMTSDDAATRAFHDADLWILSAPPARYREYADQVRQEYAHVPDPLFAQARAQILAGFAQRDAVYRTATARERWQARARANLEAELARLRA